MGGMRRRAAQQRCRAKQPGQAVGGAAHDRRLPVAPTEELLGCHLPALRCAGAVAGRAIFEKTPAYFDQASPHVLACALPGVRLLVMLRRPVERAYSAYRMCQRELKGGWCRLPFDKVVARTVRGEPPRLSRGALSRQPQWRRMLVMGQYALHLRRWLRAVEAPTLRVLWLEQFKRDPFGCMAAVESYLGLPPFDYRRRATRNQAGYWVVGRSKTNAAATSDAAAASLASRAGGGADASAASGAAASGGAAASPSLSDEARLALEGLYAPWQRRLLELLRLHNLSLLPIPANATDVPTIPGGGGDDEGDMEDDDDDDDDDGESEDEPASQ